MSAKVIFSGDFVTSTLSSSLFCEEFTSLVSSCDLSVCNFEAPVVTSNTYQVDKIGPAISQPKTAPHTLAQHGYNVVALANNHMLDFGEQGLQATMSSLKEAGIQYFGAGLNQKDAYKPLILDVKGIKLGLIACGESQFGCLEEGTDFPGYAWVGHSAIKQHIQQLKLSCDYVILNIHAGLEDVLLPLPEWRQCYRDLCNLGADIIIGHHPHVAQGYEYYKDSVIFYSLGNLFFDTEECINNPLMNSSYSVVFDFNKDRFEFDVVYHNFSSGMLEVGASNVDIDVLNEFLDKNYIESCDHMCNELYSSVYREYYRVASQGISRSLGLLGLIKCFIKAVFFERRGEKNRELMLLHNISIETHRYVVSRALRYRAGKNE